MSLSRGSPRRHIVVDNIHGDIELNELERRVIDTASFQRLRHLKQLQMGHVTYPNATHTRFAHSLGVLGIMERVSSVAGDILNLSSEQKEDLRLAGLLHDVGHYPYSHLMEGLDKVILTEELLNPTKIQPEGERYPDHEELGELILTSQKDLITAIGSRDRAQRIVKLFRGQTIEGQAELSKLVHSSLDMDRLDYLLRDARATGVPYGNIDLHYLLNNLRVSKSGAVGISEKATAAAEHVLLARFYMYRIVSYHKTTFGIEEACRHLLRRLRDKGDKAVPRDGKAVMKLVRSSKLTEFTDSMVDKIVLKASKSQDEVIGPLATAVLNRRPPKLLKEVSVLAPKDHEHHEGTAFKDACKFKLAELANKFRIPVGLFLCCETKPLCLEERSHKVTAEEARELPPLSKEELIKVFREDAQEPETLVSIKHSLIHHLAHLNFRYYRLYVVCNGEKRDELADQLKGEVAPWGRIDGD